MACQRDYEDDVLVLQEEITFTSPKEKASTSTNTRWQIKPSTKSNSEEVPNKPVIRRLTPHTKPTLQQPAIINGKLVTNLDLLKVTNTMEELKSRQSNSYQRFLTRDGDTLYLNQTILSRIKFEDIKKKRRDQTINLPERFQARLRVKPDGTILFHHYHKRGMRKLQNDQRTPKVRTRSINFRTVSSTEGNMFEPTSTNNLKIKIKKNK